MLYEGKKEICSIFLKDFRRKTPSAAAVASVLSFFSCIAAWREDVWHLEVRFQSFESLIYFGPFQSPFWGNGKPSQKVWLGIVYVVESVSHFVGCSTHIRI